MLFNFTIASPQGKCSLMIVTNMLSGQQWVVSPLRIKNNSSLCFQYLTLVESIDQQIHISIFKSILLSQIHSKPHQSYSTIKNLAKSFPENLSIEISWWKLIFYIFGSNSNSESNIRNFSGNWLQSRTSSLFSINWLPVGRWIIKLKADQEN